MKEAIYTNHSSHVSMLNSMRGKADEYVASNIRKEYSQLHQDSPLKPITGVLINSKLISDNSGLEVHVYGEEYKDNETEPDNELSLFNQTDASDANRIVWFGKCFIEIVNSEIKCDCSIPDGDVNKFKKM